MDFLNVDTFHVISDKWLFKMHADTNEQGGIRNRLNWFFFHQAHADQSDPSVFPTDDTLAEAANYCRSPTDANAPTPWCLTMDPRRWQEMCNIPRCLGICWRHDMEIVSISLSLCVRESSGGRWFPSQRGRWSAASVFTFISFWIY